MQQQDVAAGGPLRLRLWQSEPPQGPCKWHSLAGWQTRGPRRPSQSRSRTGPGRARGWSWYAPAASIRAGCVQAREHTGRVNGSSGALGGGLAKFDPLSSPGGSAGFTTTTTTSRFSCPRAIRSNLQPQLYDCRSTGPDRTRDLVIVRAQYELLGAKAG